MPRIDRFIQQDVLLVEGPELSSGVYTYVKQQVGQIFILPSSKVFMSWQTGMSSIFAKNKEKQPKSQNFQFYQYMRHLEREINEDYQRYYRQNFYTGTGRHHTFVALDVDKIRLIQVVLSQLQTKKGQPDAPNNQCLFIDYQTDEQDRQGHFVYRQILIIPQTFNNDESAISSNLHQIFDNIQFRRLLYASASAHLRNSLALLKSLECDKVDLSISAHLHSLKLCVLPIRAHLQRELGNTDAVDMFTRDIQQDSLFWRRIGFQSTKPQSDFRASGLFGLLVIVYLAYFSPEFLLNGSYSEKFSTNEAILDYMGRNGKTGYNYPIAISVISIAHEVIASEQIVNIANENTQLFKVLINDYISDSIATVIHIDEIIQCMEDQKDKYQLLSAAEMVVRQSAEDDRDQVDNAGINKSNVLQQHIDNLRTLKEMLGRQDACTVDELFQQLIKPELNQAQYLPIQPVDTPHAFLSATNPWMCGGLMKMICYLGLELNRRLSFYEKTQQYLNYTGSFSVLMSDLQQVLKQQDVCGVDDLIYRVSRTW